LGAFRFPGIDEASSGGEILLLKRFFSFFLFVIDAQDKQAHVCHFEDF
jgi:hypothetical protein